MMPPEPARLTEHYYAYQGTHAGRPLVEHLVPERGERSPYRALCGSLPALGWVLIRPHACDGFPIRQCRRCFPDAATAPAAPGE